MKLADRLLIWYEGCSVIYLGADKDLKFGYLKLCYSRRGWAVQTLL